MSIFQRAAWGFVFKTLEVWQLNSFIHSLMHSTFAVHILLPGSGVTEVTATCSPLGEITGFEDSIKDEDQTQQKS